MCALFCSHVLKVSWRWELWGVCAMSYSWAHATRYQAQHRYANNTSHPDNLWLNWNNVFSRGKYIFHSMSIQSVICVCVYNVWWAGGSTIWEHSALQGKIPAKLPECFSISSYNSHTYEPGIWTRLFIIRSILEAKSRVNCEYMLPRGNPPEEKKTNKRNVAWQW